MTHPSESQQTRITRKRVDRLRQRGKKAGNLLAFLARRIFSENLSFMAGGMAFYTLLSVFPAMTALVSVYGLVSDVADVQEQMEKIRVLLPPQAFDILYKQLVSIVSVSSKSLSMTVIAGFVMALLSAARGMKAMLAALNLVYKVHEKRKWWKRNLIAYGLTFAGIIFLALSIFSLVALPLLLKFFQVPELIADQVAYIRWFFLSGILIMGLVVLYRLGPAREPDLRHGLSMLAGAIVGSVLWLGMSWGFTNFVAYFPQFNQVYGSLGAVVILMVWFFLSAYAVIVGAAVNAALEEYYDI